MTREGAAFAVAVLGLAAAAGFSLKEAAAPEVAQGALGLGSLQHHISASPAVTAIGPAPGLKAGSLETDAARAAGAAPDGDHGLIRKGFQVGG